MRKLPLLVKNETSTLEVVILGNPIDFGGVPSMEFAYDPKSKEHIDAGKKLTCPLLVLWGQEGTVGRCFDPLKEWKIVAEDVRGEALPSGHYIPEEIPDLLFEHVRDFFSNQNKNFPEP